MGFHRKISHHKQTEIVLEKERKENIGLPSKQKRRGGVYLEGKLV